MAAIFRPMWVGGKGIFASAPPAIVVPPVGNGALFAPMRAPNGVALFRGAVPGTTPIRQFEDTLIASFSFLYEAGDSKEYEDVLEALFTLGFSMGAGLNVGDVLEATHTFTYEDTTQAQIGDVLESTVMFDFDVKARMRGWNDEKGIPETDWVPEPKPDLF
jgi:hypothetical protein